MFGRAPMMVQPTFAPEFPVLPYPPQQPVSPAPPMPSQPTAWQPAANPGWRQQPAPLMAQQPPPRPTIRAQAPDDPPPEPVESRPTPLQMPSPEQLGVADRHAEGGLDWTAAHRRLDLLGAVCFHSEKLAQGGCRFTCVLPTTEPGRQHRVEVEAASEAAAVGLALDKAEEWAGSK